MRNIKMDRISLYMCLSVSPQIICLVCLSCQLIFHQRPDIRAPKYQFTYHDQDAVTPGYIFVGPYPYSGTPAWRPEFRPCQTGPHIYDMDGVSVYSVSSLIYGLILLLGTCLERSVSLS